MTLLKSYVVCDLEFEIINRINGNLLFFQVNPNELIKKIILNVIVVDAFKTVIVTSPYERWFKQFGDSVLLMYVSIKTTTYQTLYIIFNVYDSVFEQYMSHVVGFILKD